MSRGEQKKESKGKKPKDKQEQQPMKKVSH